MREIDPQDEGFDRYIHQSLMEYFVVEVIVNKNDQSNTMVRTLVL